LVALADHREASVRTAAEQLVAAGHKALTIRCDVADERQVAAMVEQTVSAFGGWMRLSTMQEFDRVNAMRLELNSFKNRISSFVSPDRSRDEEERDLHQYWPRSYRGRDSTHQGAGGSSGRDLPSHQGKPA
jgi:hypothetical protein